MTKGYARKILATVYERRFTYIERLVTKELGVVYILGDYVPADVNSFVCGCGVRVGWRGPYPAPLCPKCHPESLLVKVKAPKVKAIEATKVDRDGIYVDYSERNGVCTLGFAVARDGIVVIETSVRGLLRHGETEAVRLVKSLNLGLNIFCDHMETCRRESVIYVKRNQNPAHKTAYYQRGFVDRASLGKALNVASDNIGPVVDA